MSLKGGNRSASNSCCRTRGMGSLVDRPWRSPSSRVRYAGLARSRVAEPVPVHRHWHEARDARERHSLPPAATRREPPRCSSTGRYRRWRTLPSRHAGRRVRFRARPTEPVLRHQAPARSRSSRLGRHREHMAPFSAGSPAGSHTTWRSTLTAAARTSAIGSNGSHPSETSWPWSVAALDRMGSGSPRVKAPRAIAGWTPVRPAGSSDRLFEGLLTAGRWFRLRP